MNIHFVGIEGVSMRVLARIMESRGATVTGSDISTTGHSAEFCRGKDMVVYTSSVGENNVELEYARQNNIPTYERAEFLGWLASLYRHVIAVSGSHGKTTTTGMLAEIFAPLSATVHIGGETNIERGHIGGKEYFITEACEYRRSFLHLSPEVAIALNVELDHTDYYADLADITSAFRVFIESAKTRIINGDDANSNSLMTGLVVTFGLEKYNDYYADNINKSARGWSFDVFEYGNKLGRIDLNIDGKHNIHNALAAICASRAYNLNFSAIKRGLENFKGIKRRFEFVGDYNGADVFSDYAHHPSELKSSINSARERGYKNIHIVFQPHTYSRTKSLMQEFASVLESADDVILAKIYPAREEAIEGVTSQALCYIMCRDGAKAACFDTFYELITLSRARAKPGDAVIFAGAGSIDAAARLMVDKNYFCAK